jgi:hypothetical protein
MGYTVKLAPLFEEPIIVPPEDTVYHLMVLPGEIALRFDDTPQVTELGLAVTLVGAAGGLTVTVTAVRDELAQVLYASA